VLWIPNLPKSLLIVWRKQKQANILRCSVSDVTKLKIKWTNFSPVFRSGKKCVILFELIESLQIFMCVSCVQRSNTVYGLTLTSRIYLTIVDIGSWSNFLSRINGDLIRDLSSFASKRGRRRRRRRSDFILYCTTCSYSDGQRRKLNKFVEKLKGAK